jgi:hypothetical protein
MKTQFIRAVAVGAIALASAGSALAIDPTLTTTPGLEFTGGTVVNNQSSRNLTLGYEFVVAAPVTVNALAYYNYVGTPSHEVGLWDSSGNLLVSAAVMSTDTLIGSFLYHPIDPVALQSGSRYVVGGLNLGGEWVLSASSIQTASGIQYLQNRYSGSSSSLTYPTSTFSGEDYGYFGGSIGIAPVPEPETYAMMVAGIGLIGCMARRRKLQQASA